MAKNLYIVNQNENPAPEAQMGRNLFFNYAGYHFCSGLGLSTCNTELSPLRFIS